MLARCPHSRSISLASMTFFNLSLSCGGRDRSPAGMWTWLMLQSLHCQRQRRGQLETSAKFEREEWLATSPQTALSTKADIKVRRWQCGAP